MSRELNDYESMLVTSTVSVAVNLDAPDEKNVEKNLREAWLRLTNRFDFLRGRLSATGDMGVLGPRQRVDIELDERQRALMVHFARGDEALATLETLENALVEATRTSLGDMLACLRVTLFANTLRLVLSLNHSVSDGPGAWAVLNALLVELTSTSVSPSSVSQPLLSLEHELLAVTPTNDAGDALFARIDEARAAASSNDGFLPVQAKQCLPADATATASMSTGHVRAVFFELEAATVASLREAARGCGGSVQGCISAAALLARLSTLETPLPIAAALQLPVNSRSAATRSGTCMCGSTGAWLVVEVRPELKLLALAAQVTKRARAAIERGQHVEWLRRLLAAPATLPPYSLMSSSLGVFDLSAAKRARVRRVRFLAGAVASEASVGAAATMVHASTLEHDGVMRVSCNFLTPGVDEAFARREAALIEGALRRMASSRGDDVASFLESSK